MSYSNRLFIFIRADRISTANSVAAAQDPDTGGNDTFGGVRLSVDGQEPMTWTATNTQATDTMKTGYELALSNPPWGIIYNAADGWTWDSALSDMGLQVIQEPL